MARSQHPISLASGVVPDATPLQTVRAAAAAGFDAVGLWFDAATWSVDTTRDVRTELAGSGLHLLDLEVLWLRPGAPDPSHHQLLDVALELGARNVLVVSADPDRATVAERYAALCDRAAGTSLRVALEFGAFTELPTIDDAAAILTLVAHPNAALLVDALHLTRSGGDAAAVARLPRRWLSYAQLCDAPLHGPAMHERSAIREEAVDGRRVPGEGELPLDAVLHALPDGLPLSIEVRSKHLRNTYPDVTERARIVAAATRHWLARNDESLRGAA